MELRALLFCQYATFGQDQQLVVAGVADGVTVRARDGIDLNKVPSIPLPRIYLVAILEASIGDGLHHLLGIRVLGEDGGTVFDNAKLIPFNFEMNPHGRPMKHNAIISLSGMRVPRLGDYEFKVLVNGNEIGWPATFYVDEEKKPPRNE